MTIKETLVKLRDDIKLWATNNFNALNVKVESKIDKDGDKVLSSNDYTDNDKSKLDAMPSPSVVATTDYVDEQLGTKVNKVEGKDLSTNDFTNAYKEQMDTNNFGDNNEINLDADYEGSEIGFVTGHDNIIGAKVYSVSEFTVGADYTLVTLNDINDDFTTDLLEQEVTMVIGDNTDAFGKAILIDRANKQIKIDAPRVDYALEEILAENSDTGVTKTVNADGSVTYSGFHKDGYFSDWLYFPYLTDEEGNPKAIGTRPASYGGSSFGSYNAVWGLYATAFGIRNVAGGKHAVVMGRDNAGGYASFVNGRGNKAMGNCATAIGTNNTASGRFSFAGGNDSIASETSAVAIGDHAKASGIASLALGYDTEASGMRAVAINRKTKATGKHSFASGSETTASGEQAFASGYKSVASGNNSVASGENALSSGNRSFAHGYDVKATHANQIVFGRNNENKETSLFELGYGTVGGTPVNMFEVTKTGEGYLNKQKIATEKYVDEKISAGGGGSNVQSDWNESDSNAADYVKNRTHYGVSDPDVVGISQAGNSGYNSTQKMSLANNSVTEAIVHRYGNGIDEWYSVPVTHDFGRSGLRVAGVFEILEYGEYENYGRGPWVDFGYLEVSAEYDGNTCYYDVYANPSSAEKVLDPRYLPMNFVLSDVKKELDGFATEDYVAETLNAVFDVIGPAIENKVDKEEGKVVVTSDANTPMEIVVSATQPTPVAGKTIIWIDTSVLS